MTQAPEAPATSSASTGNQAAADVPGTSPPGVKALVYDYRQAANPIRPGLTEPLVERRWGPELHSQGPTAVLPLDLSQEMGCPGPATSPALSANFIRILEGESIEAAAVATSSLFYVWRGSGHGTQPGKGGGPTWEQPWQADDLFVVPAGEPVRLQAFSETVLYWVHDAPLLTYLGVNPAEPRFEPTHYPGAWLRQELETLAADPSSARSNRLSLLLANRDLPASRTVTHTLWAMLGMVPAGAIQPPHRHQSVALDLVIDCDPGCATLSGRELNGDGTIANPTRMEWEPGAAFKTPPGLWHSHVNESGRTALLLPIQDAGLHTHLRSLDIRFS